jgi:hypothetical protein
MLFRVFIVKRVGKLLCTLVGLVIFRGPWFELFKLHGTILFFFAKFFGTQVAG